MGGYVAAKRLHVVWALGFVLSLAFGLGCAGMGGLKLPPPHPDTGYGINGSVGKSSVLAAQNENLTLVDANTNEVVARTTTDFLGRYKIYPLRPGQYILLAGNKQLPVTITNDHVRLDVDLSSETGAMDYASGSPPTAMNEPAQPGAAQPGGAQPGGEGPGGSPGGTTGEPPPGATGGTPGTGGPGGGKESAIVGCFSSKYTGISLQYWFDGAGTVKNLNWNPASGSYTYTGMYRFDGTNLLMVFEGEAPKLYRVMRLDQQGIQWGDDTGSWTYEYAGPQCP